MEKDPLIIAGKAYNSRLLVGTGKYSSEKQALEAIKASNSEAFDEFGSSMSLNQAGSLLAI